MYQMLRFCQDFLCHSLENAPEFHKAGMINSFITLMSSERPPNIVFEASWCLCNMAASNYTEDVCSAGGLSAFLRAARRADIRITETCLHGIACLVHESP